MFRVLGKTGGNETAAAAAFAALADGRVTVLAGGFGDFVSDLLLGVGGVMVVPASCADADPLVSSPIDLVVALSSPPAPLLEASTLWLPLL